MGGTPTDDGAGAGRGGMRQYYDAKLRELAVVVAAKEQNLKRLEAQRNELNGRGARGRGAGGGRAFFFRPIFTWLAAEQFVCCATSCRSCRSLARTWARW